jgi:hypothetical protein
MPLADSPLTILSPSVARLALDAPRPARRFLSWSVSFFQLPVSERWTSRMRGVMCSSIPSAVSTSL